MNKKIILGLLAIATVLVLRDVFFTVFLGILVASIFIIPVDPLSRHMNRNVALILTLIAGLGALVGTAYLTYVPLSKQVGQLERQVPAALSKVENWIERKKAESFGARKGETETNATQIGGFLKNTLAKVGDIAAKVASLFSLFIIVVILGAFFSDEPEVYRNGLRTLVPQRYEPTYDDLWNRLSDGLVGWLRGILISMTLMGSFTAIALMIAGIQNWLLLGLLTFLGTFVPYLGAISSSVPGLLMALSQSSEKFLLAAGIYLAVHILEGYIVQPLVMKRAVTIRPAALLIWQLVMGAWGGVFGIVVATPLYVCVKIIVDSLYVKRVLNKESP